MLSYATFDSPGLLESIGAAAVFHDLGKLDPDIQASLKKGRSAKLKWDHIDAGVAHLSAQKNWMAAWLVRAHHAPGLPQKQEHFNPDGLGRRLRGRRRDDDEADRHKEQIERTNLHLNDYLARHQSEAGSCPVGHARPAHGLTLRLALSCLVDADHTDTAFFDTGRLAPAAPEPRWAERLQALSRYVDSLPQGRSEAERARNSRRAAFFRTCMDSAVREPMVACEGPVGIGKTTAVSAYLIRRAQEAGLRRLIIVAPYTNILTQTADALRKALVLPDEREHPERVIVEHHHRADFESLEDRELAVLWQAPVVLTTAVNFFETLAACDPASLRKLHSVPGSAIFIDEAHDALPTRLWPQSWRWLRELAERWSCRFVFASGSLVRFWEEKEIVDKAVKLPELLPPAQAADLATAELRRVRYKALCGGEVIGVARLLEEMRRQPGPRLVILNTVQSAAVVAWAMRDAGLDAMHLSTALTPADRERILKRIKNRLSSSTERDWSLVATSCVEAGVDLSFRAAFRERFRTASTIQVGGRVNRHGEYDPGGGGTVFDFALFGEGITQHPAAAISADVLRELLTDDEINRNAPADVVTEAMRRELSRAGGLGANPLEKAEGARDYPGAAEHGRVIDAPTRLVVVDKELQQRVIEWSRDPRSPEKRVSFHDLLSGSVQIWATKIGAMGLDLLPGRRELYAWRGLYDCDFIGYMAGVLQNLDFQRQGGAVI